MQDGSSTTCSQLQSGSALITVNPLPTAIISGTTDVCKNGTAPTITFTGADGTAPYTFTYKINGGANQTVAATGTNVSASITASTINSGAYTYTLISVQDASTTTCSQTQTGNALITINPLPTATISGTTAVCINTNAPLVTLTGANGTSPYTFTYNINGGSDQTASTTTGNSTTISAPTNVADPFIYNLVSVQDASSTTCLQNQTGNATITINPLPVPLASASPYSICDGASTTLNGSGGGTYNWTSSQGGYSSATQNPIVTPTTTTTYTLNVTLAGCTASDTTVVTVKPIPPANAGADIAICEGTSTTLTATGGNSYIWSSSSDPNKNDLNQATSSSPVATPTITTTYTVNVSLNGCNKTDDMVVTVIPIPIPSITAAPASICIGETSTLTGSSSVAYSGIATYKWSSGSTGTPIEVKPSSTTLYTVTATNGTSCSATATKTVTVNPIPTILFSSDIKSGCAPLVVNFTDLSNNAILWNWSFSDPLSANNTSNISSPSHTFNSAGSYDISLSITDNNYCHNSLKIPNMIIVNEIPKADFIWTPDVASYANPELRFNANGSSTNVVSWDWLFTDIYSGDSTANTLIANHTYSLPGQYPVRLIVSTTLGCKDTIVKSITMKEDYLIYIPNAFSPNGGNGNLNDYFGPKGTGIDPDYFEMYIYTRWGQEIYKTTDLNKPWDGLINGKREASVGVYTYLIRTREKIGMTHTYTGTVTLIR